MVRRPGIPSPYTISTGDLHEVVKKKSLMQDLPSNQMLLEERHLEGDQEEYLELEDPEDQWKAPVARSLAKAKRQWLSEEYAVKMKYVDQVLWEFNLQYDELQEAFASSVNHRFASFWTKSQNSFSKSWTQTQIWANPPFTLLDKVTLKLLSDQVELVAHCCLVASYLPAGSMVC